MGAEREKTFELHNQGLPSVVSSRKGITPTGLGQEVFASVHESSISNTWEFPKPIMW